MLPVRTCPKPQKQMAEIAPMLSVKGGARAIEYEKRAFDAMEIFRLDGGEGGVVARLALGASEFWVADESPEHLNFSPESLGGSSVRMVLTVENPDSVFEKAIAAGAKQRNF